MTEVPHTDEIKQVVHDYLTASFTDIEVVSISVDRTIDADDDDVLLVKVVFKARTKKRLDPQKTSGLVRHIRPNLADIGETAFPVFSFIADSEMRNIHAETA